MIHSILFHLPPETAHDMVARLLCIGGRFAAVRRAIRTISGVEDSDLRRSVFGVDFPNPVGLAAGWDKDAVAVPVWPSFGFGFAEIGSVTALPQPGNPKPRLFRQECDLALINRMGFNNDGAHRVATRLENYRRRGLLGLIPLGVNLGKSRVVDIDKAASDYTLSLELLYPYGSYFAINVSSPNTPGLRRLQDRDRLEELLTEVQRRSSGLADACGIRPKPILLKIAPDLTESQIDEILCVVETCRVAGVIATNTTVSRDGLTHPVQEDGGLSGRPLRARSTEVVRYIQRRSEGRLPIIGVGGIFSADDAREKMDAGASLVQLYTGFVYGGPRTPGRICRELAAMRADR